MIDLPYSLTDHKEMEAALVWLNKYWNKPTQPLYYLPKTLDEAISLLDGYRGEAKIIAGGIDLVGLMKCKVLSPRVLINIKEIPSLGAIDEEASGLKIGALTTLDDIERSTLIRSKYPLLFDITQSLGSPQIRNMGTIGGNLCQEVRCWYYRRSPLTGISFTCRRKKEGEVCYAVNGENENHAIFGENGCFAVAPSDMATGLLSLDARINTFDKKGGRIIPISKFYTPLGHILEPDEMITSIHVPNGKPDTRYRYLKFRSRKAIDFSTVSVSSVITMVNNIIDDAKIVVGGVSPMPHEAVRAEEILKGEPLNEKIAEKAANATVSDAIPLSKNGYKIPIVKALIKRSLLE